MSLKTKIESLLFVSIRPLSGRKIANLLKAQKKEVDEALEELQRDLTENRRGIRLMKIGESWQLATAPENSSLIKSYLKDEQTGELTRPALETLTIIAYRGPISKAELDVIRGVNCSLILRNLMIKGLVESIQDEKEMITKYQITFDFLKFLGISKVSELPEYEKLNKDENLEKLLHPETAEENKDNAPNGEIK